MVFKGAHAELQLLADYQVSLELSFSLPRSGVQAA